MHPQRRQRTHMYQACFCFNNSVTQTQTLTVMAVPAVVVEDMDTDKKIDSSVAEIEDETFEHTSPLLDDDVVISLPRYKVRAVLTSDERGTSEDKETS